MDSQRTSTDEQKGVSDGLSRQLGRMAEDASRNYSGGTEKAELAKGHPSFGTSFHELLDRLAAEQALRLPIIQRPAWKTLELGNQPNADGYRNELKQNGFKISDWANDIMGKPAFMVSAEPTTVELVLMTVAELGFENGATRKDIYERALSLGLELCPPEVGPALRLAYQDQPKGEWILVGMEPIVDSDGFPYVFRVGRGGHDRWLRAFWDYPGYRWYADRRWVFARRK